MLQSPRYYEFATHTPPSDYHSRACIGERWVMRKLIALTGTTLMFVAALAAGQGPRTGEPSGELLYSTHCIACHTTQVHWREKRLATDWTSLKFQVRRWQENIGLDLGEDDVAAVASYLNGLYYHFPATDAGQSGESDATRRVTVRRQD